MFYLFGLVVIGTIALVFRLRYLNKKAEIQRFEMLNECKGCKCGCRNK